MTNQEKSSFLKQYLISKRDIDRLGDEILSWEERAVRITPGYSGLPYGGSREDKLQTAVAEIDSLVSELKAQTQEVIKTRNAVFKVIHTIKNDTLRQIMIYRYIDGKKWDEIAMLMDYEPHYVLRLHSKALNSIRKEDIERYRDTVI